MTTETALRQPETSDERLTAIETHLPYLATREDVLTSREYMERSMREQSSSFHDALREQSDRFHSALNAQSEKTNADLREHSERFYEALNTQSDKFHIALREQSAGFYAALMKQSADAQAQARSDRRWIIGTIITVGLAIAGLVVGMAG